MRWGYCFVLAALLAWPVHAQEPPESKIRQFDLPTLERLGSEMYAQDQAAWHAPFLVMTAKDTVWMVHQGKISKFDMSQPPKP